jgi:TonB-dependent SusC/RagA subfamily outer membrane receptor
MKTEDIDKKIGMPDVTDEWAKFESEVINKEEAVPRKSRRPLYIWLGGLGIAASLLLLFVLNMKDELAEEPQLTAQTMIAEGVIEETTAEETTAEETAKKDIVKVPSAQLIAQVKAYEQNSDSNRMTGIDDDREEEVRPSGTPRRIEMREYEGLGYTSIDEALQGRIAGLDVVENAGDLGSGNNVRLRGTSEMSSSGDDSPLIVLNGEALNLRLDDEVLKHATDKDFLRILRLEGQTVESIRVLKDATATAVYGRQGWNGVIEITTKPIKTLPDSLIAKVKAYEKKSDPKILVGRDHKDDSLQSRNRNPKYGLPIPHREVTGKINMEDFEGIMIKIDEVEDNTKYVVPSSRIAPIIKQKRAKKNQPKSITFKVDENLKALEKTVVAHYDGRLAAQYLLGQDGVKVEDQHVVALSFADAQNLRIVVKDAFYQCMVKAYAEHKSVTLSPDMMWLLISQGFARYVNAHSEELRSQLVYHEGKQDLMVMTKDDLLSGKADWGKLMNDFSKEIERHTKGEVAKTIAADFSTTTPVERIASQITLMESMKSYFNYLAVRIGCGIPSVTLQGTPDDWRAVLSKTQKLGQYGLSEWTQTLEPILNEFIKTAEGSPNQRFWQEMVKKQRVDEFASVRPCSADKPTEFDGWILKFFPTEDGYTLDRVPYTKSMPAEFVRVEFKYRVIDPITGATLSETPMELMSGFVGALDDEKNNMLTPQIGWLVRARE